MAVSTPADQYGYAQYKERSGQEWSLNIDQQKALFEFFHDMGPFIYERLFPLVEKIEQVENLPADIRAEQVATVRTLRKSWEYIADNFNTIGVEEEAK